MFKEGASLPSVAVATASGMTITGAPVVRVGGVGTELKKVLSWFGQYAHAGCSCTKYAAIMDAKGPEWCEANTKTIIDWLVSEAQQRSVYEIFAGRPDETDQEDMYAEGITEEQANALLAELEEQPADKPKAIAMVNLLAFRFAARRAVRMAIGNAKKKLTQPAIWQVIDRKKYPPLIGKPIDPTRLKEHILYHVMPLAGDTEWVWRRHIAWLREVRPAFNGRLIVGIVTHAHGDQYQYVPPDVVQAAFDGMDAEFVEAPNDVKPGHRRGIGEGVLFPLMLERLRTKDPDQVFYYGHCKGVTRPGPPDSVPNRWATAMFDTLFRNRENVTCLLDHFGVAGPFLMRGGFRPGLPGVGLWYFYSGTFFAMRLADVFNRNWKERLAKTPYYGCIEQFPRLLFHLETEAACVFMDDTQNLYDETYWAEQVEPALVEWRAANA